MRENPASANLENPLRLNSNLSAAPLLTSILQCARLKTRSNLPQRVTLPAVLTPTVDETPDPRRRRTALNLMASYLSLPTEVRKT